MPSPDAHPIATLLDRVAEPADDHVVHRPVAVGRVPLIRSEVGVHVPVERHAGGLHHVHEEEGPGPIATLGHTRHKLPVELEGVAVQLEVGRVVGGDARAQLVGSCDRLRPVHEHRRTEVPAEPVDQLRAEVVEVLLESDDVDGREALPRARSSTRRGRSRVV